MDNGSPARGSVLVVDDEPTITEVVSRCLERAGYETRIAGDGRSALALAVCRAIVEAHGGEIWFADSPGGPRVRFGLPRAA